MLSSEQLTRRTLILAAFSPRRRPLPSVPVTASTIVRVTLRSHAARPDGKCRVEWEPWPCSAVRWVWTLR